MARPTTGNVRVRKTARGESFEIRFSAYGERRYQHLGTRAQGWTIERAELELQNVLADVRRGLWKPAGQPESAAEPRAVPTFHEFASEWFAAKCLEGRPRRHRAQRKGCPRPRVEAYGPPTADIRAAAP